MILATTTSTEDTGLLDVLLPDFEKQTGIAVKVIAVGTGAALAMAAKGDADAVLVHAPASEKEYVDRGDLVGGRLVMHNDFVLVGPASDPAQAADKKDIGSALKAIADRGVFVSRGDDSGTHKKELELWKAAGVDPKALKRREETGQGMGATLHVADQREGYALTDRATYLALKRKLKLKVVFEGDRRLLNVYHVHEVSQAKHPGVKSPLAKAFAEFLVAPATQKRIAEFGRADHGEPLFTADAGKDEASLGKQPPSAGAPAQSAPKAAPGAPPIAPSPRP
jgi:tungstate transport system substrate-binding protein